MLLTLQDSEWIVREAAVLALERLGEYGSSGLLLAAICDQDVIVHDAATRALQRSQLSFEA